MIVLPGRNRARQKGDGDKKTPTRMIMIKIRVCLVFFSFFFFFYHPLLSVIKCEPYAAVVDLSLIGRTAALRVNRGYLRHV